MILLMTFCSLLFAEDISKLRNDLTKALLENNVLKADSISKDILIESNKLGIAPFSTFELFTIKMITKDSLFFSNSDTLEHYLSDEYKSQQLYLKDPLYLNIFKLFKSNQKSPDFQVFLGSLQNDTRTLVQIMALGMDTLSIDSTDRAIRTEIAKISDTKIAKLINEKIWYDLRIKQQIGFYFGGGISKPIGGSENLLASTGAMEFGLNYARKRVHGDFGINIVNYTLVDTLITPSYRYPEQIDLQNVRLEFNTGYQIVQGNVIQLTPYIGFIANILSIPSAVLEKHDTLPKISEGGVGFISGIQSTILFPSTSSKNSQGRDVFQFGAQLKCSYSSLNEKNIQNISGGTFNVTLSLLYLMLEREINKEE